MPAEPAPIRTERLSLEPLDPDLVRLMISGERTLHPEFPTDDDRRGFLPIQLKRMETNPDRRGWMARLMVTHDGELVGHCGFHGPPDAVGRAEIGYTVFTPFRGKGFAKEAAGALTRWAFEQGEERVFASVSPSNYPSLAVIRQLGFVQIGTQDDEVDGLELVFAIEKGARPAP